MSTLKKLVPYIVDRAEKAEAKYEVHSFDSGTVMIDIWVDNRIYVVQIDGDTIGLSLNTEETMLFDIIPNNLFKDVNTFINEFEKIFL